MNSSRSFLTIALVCLVLAGLFYVLLRPKDGTGTTPTNTSTKQTEKSFVFPPAPLETVPSSDPNIRSEKEGWVHIVINNQFGLKTPRTVLLPVDWIAREDYLITILPETFKKDFLMQKTIIMRPPKSMRQGRDDAIYSVPEISDPYFKPERCIKTSVGYTCYGGDNPITKHVFEILFK